MEVASFTKSIGNGSSSHRNHPRNVYYEESVQPVLAMVECILISLVIFDVVSLYPRLLKCLI